MLASLSVFLGPLSTITSPLEYLMNREIPASAISSLYTGIIGEIEGPARWRGGKKISSSTRPRSASFVYTAEHVAKFYFNELLRTRCDHYFRRRTVNSLFVFSFVYEGSSVRNVNK